MKYFGIFLVGLGVTVGSCSNNDNNGDEPAPTSPMLRIVSISTEVATSPVDDIERTFGYNANGEITEYHYREIPTARNIADACYYYEPDGSALRIEAQEMRGNEKWVFEEILSLNQDKTAKSAEGLVCFYSVDDNSLTRRKRYSVVFHYDDTNHLKSLQIVEKNAIDDRNDPHPLKWNIDLTWRDGNLVEYKEYMNPVSPLSVSNYTYYEGSEIEYIPINQHPILRHYYTPLQYQGYLGTLSKEPIRKVTMDGYDAIDYTYSVSTKDGKNVVENYFETRPGGRHTKYLVTWE